MHKEQTPQLVQMPVKMKLPEPLVFTPSATHKYTILLLHGRGRKADAFAGEMIPLQQALPHAKLVFPWAPKHRATVYKKSLTSQWFDDWHLSPDLQSTDVVHSRYDEGLQTSGLGETVAYLHALIAEEAAIVGGAQNVVLGGFSQGAAASLVAALLWDGEQRLGAVLAMCAWLPYTKQMAQLLQRGDDEGDLDNERGKEQKGDEVDLFERTPSQDEEIDPGIEGVEAVLEWLREEIDLPRSREPRWRKYNDHTPVMFCHGLNDEKVAPERSQRASEFLLSLGLDSVERKEYPGVGHETCGGIKADMVAFLQLVLEEDATLPMVS